MSSQLVGVLRMTAVQGCQKWVNTYAGKHVPEGIDAGETYTLKIHIFDHRYKKKDPTATKKAVAVEVISDRYGHVETTSPVWIRRLFGLNLGAGHWPNVDGGLCYVPEILTQPA